MKNKNIVDGRYKDGVDAGRFSSNKIILPLKSISSAPKVGELLTSVDDIPKQRLRHQAAKTAKKKKKKRLKLQRQYKSLNKSK